MWGFNLLVIPVSFASWPAIFNYFSFCCRVLRCDVGDLVAEEDVPA